MLTGLCWQINKNKRVFWVTFWRLRSGMLNFLSHVVLNKWSIFGRLTIWPHLHCPATCIWINVYLSIPLFSGNSFCKVRLYDRIVLLKNNLWQEWNKNLIFTSEEKESSGCIPLLLLISLNHFLFCKEKTEFNILSLKAIYQFCPTQLHLDDQCQVWLAVKSINLAKHYKITLTTRFTKQEPSKARNQQEHCIRLGHLLFHGLCF